MADVTLDALLVKQKEMAELASSLSSETGADRIQELAAELQRRGEELSRMAEELVAQQGNPKAQRGTTEVALTPAQKQRIREATGVELDTILLQDDAGIAARTMPITDPRIIEYRALQEAKRIKEGREAEAM